MNRPTTRLGRALVWWANSDGDAIPPDHAKAISGLLSYATDEECYDLNGAGRSAMRKSGYRSGVGSAWVPR